jgi:hypothetical protein
MPGSLRCQNGFCQSTGASETCSASVYVDAAVDSFNADFGDGKALGQGGDTRRRHSSPQSPPSIIFISFDSATLSRPDLVSAADDGLNPGDGFDLVFDAVVTGPSTALVLVAGADLTTPSTTGKLIVWDIIIGSQPFPAPTA